MTAARPTRMTREEEAAYHSRRMADQIERATAAIAAGSFTSAARQKEALGHLNSAYEHLRSMAHGVAVQAGWDRMPEGARIAEWTDAELRRTDELIAAKYANPAWNHKR